MLLIVFAVVFLVALFLIKNTSLFKNINKSEGTGEENGLVYSTAAIGDLVNKDTDLDGVLDWEEGLWGTDPTKKETTPGTPDSAAVNKLKAEEGNNTGKTNVDIQSTEKLTETDKFSRELFSTVAALNQSGAMDQATIDQISNSLAQRIENSSQRKIFLLSDIKISTNNNIQAVKNYSDALVNIQTKYTMNNTVLDVLQKFIVDENNVDVSVLSELDPIIGQTNKIIDAMVKISVPKSLSVQHLDVINSLERLVENVNDIKLYDTDVIISLGAIIQYSQNTITLQSAISNLENAMQQKLNN